jgi:hypothetical protein
LPLWVHGRMNGAMAQLVGKLLVLMAMLLMPLGMSAAPAAAVAHHAASASMPMGHCPDQNTGDDMKSGVAECTMACAAALPAIDPPGQQRLLIACQPVEQSAAEPLHGLHPETATPPPKRS